MLDPFLSGGNKTALLKLCRNILIKEIRILHVCQFGILAHNKR
jgi:hypothetical protein